MTREDETATLDRVSIGLAYLCVVLFVLLVVVQVVRTVVDPYDPRPDARRVAEVDIVDIGTARTCTRDVGCVER